MKIVVDTNFLISLSKESEICHTTAAAWMEEITQRQLPLFLPVIVLAEYAVQGDAVALMETGDFLTVEFAQDDAITSAELLRANEKGHHAKPGDRVAIKDDFKIMAIAKRLKATHLITADEKMIRAVKAQGLCQIIPCDKPVDKSFFNKDGQHEFHYEEIHHAEHARRKEKRARKKSSQ